MAARLSLITRVPGAGCIITARQVEFCFLCSGVGIQLITCALLGAEAKMIVQLVQFSRN